MPRRILEIAVDSIVDAEAAVAAGADRLELCADLDAHGFTPSVELVRHAAKLPVQTVAMVRPRVAAPDFHYSRDAWNGVLADAEMMLGSGAGGIVFGCLRPDWAIDSERVRELVRLAAGRETVFHRAIDLTPDPLAAIHQLADLGVTRILTSGYTAAKTALDLSAGTVPFAATHLWHAGGDAWERRLERLKALVDAASGRIQILPGGGIRADNAAAVIATTGCTQLHSSARVKGRFDPTAVAGLRASIDSAR